MATIENTHFSKRVRRMLGFSLPAWENAMLISLGLAALCAMFVGITTYAVVRLQKVEVDDAKKDLEKYKLDAGQKIAEAVARAAEANLELERLKAPRTLTAEQQTRMTEKLKVFQGTTFGIVTYPWEEEAATFQSMLLGALVRAGWVIDIHHGRDSLSRLAPGVVVSLGTETPPKINDPAKALVESLTTEGFAARIEYGKVKPRSIAIEIQIGTKH